jgi:hypothetical protein
MTDAEHKAAAEKLVNAVKNNTNGAYDEWTSGGANLENQSERAAFVQKHAGLSETPSKEDLAAIAHHVNTSLQSDVADLQTRSAGTQAVGLICLNDD